MSITQYRVSPALRDMNAVCGEFLGDLEGQLMKTPGWSLMAREGVEWGRSIKAEKLVAGIEMGGFALRIRFRLKMPGGTFTDLFPGNRTVKIHKGSGRTIFKCGEQEFVREGVLQRAALWIVNGLKD